MPRRFADLMGGLESGHAAEGNETSELKHALRVFPWPDEAVEHRPHRRVIVPVDGERVFERTAALAVARVDHDIELRGGREFEMLAEEGALSFAETFLIPPIWSGMIVVQSGLADRANPRIARELREP